MIFKSFLHSKIRQSMLSSGSILLLLGLLLAACGGSAASNTASGVAMTTVGHAAHQNTSGSGSTANQTSTSTNASPTQYFIKTLDVSIAVKDPRKTANDLQNWISTADPHATSAGTTYQQVGSNLYNVTISFEVTASAYPQVERYLANYADQNNGRLISLNETVQNVTNDYVDSQSQLANLKVEQQRLQTLMSQAQSLNDVLIIQDKLTGVEGQIEQITEHIKNLSNQITYYTVTIQLQPIVIATPPPEPQGWSIGQVFHDAFSASLAFGQTLLSIAIWLLAFAIYLVPIALIVWGAYRWRGRSRRSVPPPLAPMPPPMD